MNHAMHQRALLGSTKALQHDCMPEWLPAGLQPVNNDLNARIVLPGDEAVWIPTRRPGLLLRILDFVDEGPSWVCGELRLAPGAPAAELAAETGLEFYVRQGELESSMGDFQRGLYLRLPPGADDVIDQVQLANSHPDTSARVYFTAGQMLPEDTEQRRIDTHDESLWLPGPEPGTEVMPLHGHGSQVTLLVRWLENTAFRPRIDPLGEEILVLRGCVSDTWGSYGRHSWIRNPVKAWQSWQGEAGTLILYKNGHLARHHKRDLDTVCVPARPA